jgi:hypothetical protein
VEAFRDKWLAHRPGREELVGSADLQSLADLAAASDTVGSTGLLPIGRRATLTLAALIALPYAPLLLTMIPFEDLLQRLITKMV